MVLCFTIQDEFQDFVLSDFLCLLNKHPNFLDSCPDVQHLAYHKLFQYTIHLTWRALSGLVIRASSESYKCNITLVTFKRKVLVHSPCELPHPALPQVNLQGLSCSLSHPWARVEGQNSEPRKSVKKEFDTEVGQPSTTVHFELLQKVATLGDAQTTEAKVSDCCSGQTQTGEPWTAYGKCLHSWVREPGTAAQVKVQKGGWKQCCNLVTDRIAAVSQVEDREIAATF